MVSNPTDQTDGHERRVREILDRARREAGVRDLLLFAVARVWTAVLGVAAAIYALVSRRKKSDHDPHS